MQRLLLSALGLGLLLVQATRSAAEGDPKEIIRKVIAAYGGAEKLDKYKGSKTSTKGVVMVMGKEVEYTADAVNMMPDKQKMVMHLDPKGKNAEFVSVVNGDKISLKYMGMPQEVPEGMKKEKELQPILQLTPLLRDKTYELKSIAPMNIDGKATVGVEVSGQNLKGVKLYFATDTYLLVKVEFKGSDPAGGGGEVVNELFMSGYKDVQGVKHATKVVRTAAGQKLTDATITKVELFEKIDDKEFSE